MDPNWSFGSSDSMSWFLKTSVTRGQLVMIVHGMQSSSLSEKNLMSEMKLQYLP